MWCSCSYFSARRMVESARPLRLCCCCFYLVLCHLLRLISHHRVVVVGGSCRGVIVWRASCGQQGTRACCDGKVAVERASGRGGGGRWDAPCAGGCWYGQLPTHLQPTEHPRTTHPTAICSQACAARGRFGQPRVLSRQAARAGGAHQCPAC